MPIPALLLATALGVQIPQSPANVVPSQGPATLRWVPKEGDQIRYRTTADLTIQGTPATMTAISTQKVIRVDPDGAYTVQATPSEAKVTMLGQEMQGGGLTTITTYGVNGEIKEIRGDRLEASGYRMANLTTFHSPTKSVSVGESWTTDGKSDAKTGATAWKADYKVVGEESVGPFSALKIDVVARETEGSDAGKATGSFWVTRDGIVARSEINWSNVSIPGANGPISGKITLTRLP